ncbi:MAG: BON domain-containing protein [Burkholderiales bacterium]|nr:BON domain-containing protein [Burkholderiales bacterium]
MKRKLRTSLPLTCLAAALLAGALAGCAPLVVGGAAVGGALVATDRRSSGAQLDDQTIELRSSSRLSDALGDRAHINVTSYNRQVLLTGEVPSEAAKQQAGQIVSQVDNVRRVVNELAVMAPSTLIERSNDTLITGKVRASLVDASDLQATAFHVVTERNTVYLMGRVTEREADRATAIARQIPGVQRVVRIFEVVSPQELLQLEQGGAATPASSPASAPAPAPAPVVPPAAGGGAVVTPVR